MIDKTPEQAGTEPAIDELPEALGFIETAEMAEVKSRLVSALANGDEEAAKGLGNRYDDLGEELVDAVKNSEWDRDRRLANLGFIISKALIWRDSGRTSKLIDELQIAQTLASNWNWSNPATSPPPKPFAGQWGLDPVLKLVEEELSKAKVLNASNDL